MIIEITEKNIHYTLSNENLKTGDETFPIMWGKCTKDNKWIPDKLCTTRYSDGTLMCGLPNDPHIIENLNYSNYKPYQIKTNHGYGPIEQYFKIIKQYNET